MPLICWTCVRFNRLWAQFLNLSSFPGSTAYVLTLDGSPLLWNAHTGHKYDVQDTNCPLKSIGCVFNHENVRLLVQGSYFIRLLLILNREFLVCLYLPQKNTYILVEYWFMFFCFLFLWVLYLSSNRLLLQFGKRSLIEAKLLIIATSLF